MTRFGGGLHSDLISNDVGPYLGFAVRKKVWLQRVPWLGVSAEGKLGLFQTTGELEDQTFGSYENSVGTLQAIGFLNVGIFDFGYGYGQVGVHQVLDGGTRNERVRKTAFPVSTAVFGMHVSKKNGRTIGVDIVYEKFETAKVPGGADARDSYGVLIQYGM